MNTALLYIQKKNMLDWERIVNHPLFNLGAYFFVYQVTRYAGLDNPENLYSIRTFYLGSQFIIIALSFYLMSVIKKKNGKQKNNSNKKKICFNMQ